MELLFHLLVLVNRVVQFVLEVHLSFEDLVINFLALLEDELLNLFDLLEHITRLLVQLLKFRLVLLELLIHHPGSVLFYSCSFSLLLFPLVVIHHNLALGLLNEVNPILPDFSL